jgi:hypothetical protein
MPNPRVFYPYGYSVANPRQNPYPWCGYGFLVGMGTGMLPIPGGLPVPCPNRNRLVNEAYIARHRSGKALWSAYTKPKPPLQCMSVRRLPLVSPLFSSVLSYLEHQKPGTTMDEPLKTKARTRRHKSASTCKASSSALPVQGSGK